AVELVRERLDAALDLVADPAYLVDPLAGGIRQLPVDVTLAGDVRAGVAAPHRHDDVGPFRVGALEPVWDVIRELGHQLGNFRMHACRGRAAGGPRFVPPVRGAGEERLGDLRTPGVLHADEEDTAHTGNA